MLERRAPAWPEKRSERGVKTSVNTGVHTEKRSEEGVKTSVNRTSVNRRRKQCAVLRGEVRRGPRKYLNAE